MAAKAPDSAALPVADIIGWDVANWAQCLPHWYPWVADLNRQASRVLVLGERNGGISLWFSLLGFNVICSDYRLPGQAAHELHHRWQAAERVTYAEVDVFKMPFPDEHFDVVACKSVIGGLKLKRDDASTRSLENQKLAVEEIRRVLKPGGVYLGAENLTGTQLHKAMRYLRNGGRGWRHLRIPEIGWLFEKYSSCEQQPWGFCGTNWPGAFGVNQLTGWVDERLSQWLPADWLYISFIRARK